VRDCVDPSAIHPWHAELEQSGVVGRSAGLELRHTSLVAADAAQLARSSIIRPRHAAQKRGLFMATNFTLNGEKRASEADGTTPLLWVLRDELKMTGTKFGCGAALCGACTVHLDGEAVRSCQIQLRDIQGRDVTTIEGVKGTVADAVQAAWLKLDVVQCGYCQSGQVMAAVGLLSQIPKPTDDDINKAMDGNICRCNTYHRIRAAIHEAAKTLPG
jgi:isoquinoline 1-oxidoreductase subunit alpha